MKDLISRQAAIDAFEKFIHGFDIENESHNYGEITLSSQNVPPVEHDTNKEGYYTIYSDKDFHMVMAFMKLWLKLAEKKY